MTTDARSYGITKDVSGEFGPTVARVKELLREQGFGVLTEIDVQATLKSKLGKDVEPYVILGACNPPLAAQALETEPDIGLLLPCNVIVAQRGDTIRVGAVNPQSMVDFTGNAQLATVSNDADARLRRVIDAV